MANDWNDVKPVGCKHWLVLPAVYSDALSYGDQIAHFCAALNKLIQNNNTLPEYIQQMIQEYINGGVIGEIVQSVIAEFILNVKYPPEGLTPAVGDGSSDDTEAVQGCIDYAASHNGMAVYFPSGAYSVQSLTLKSEVSLFGFDRYSTKLVLRGGATTPMISLNGSNCGIYNLTLDGNAGVQVENINVIAMNAQDVLLDNLIIQNGYQLLVYNGTGGDLQINDVIFGNAVYKCVDISGNSVVQAKGLKFNQLSSVSGVNVITISSDLGMYEIISNLVCETCLDISGNDNYVYGLVSGATNPYIDNGLRNTIDFKGDVKLEHYVGNTGTTVEGNVGYTVNKAYTEIVNGIYTSTHNSDEIKTVEGKFTTKANSIEENVTDKKNVQSNSYSETITKAKTITAGSVNENITGAKTVEANTSTENVTGAKILTAGSVNENITGNKTVNCKNETHNANIFDIANTLKYKDPVSVNSFYSNVPVLDRSGNTYNLMVATGETEELSGTIGRSDYLITIGDSYGRGEGSGTLYKYTPWVNLIKDYLGLTENVNYWTRSLGGAGFKGNAGGKNFAELLSELSTVISAENKLKVGKILVAGGYNDNSNEVAVSNITEFFNVAKANFPNATVYVASIGWGYDTFINSRIINNVVPVYVQGAAINGGIYITNSQYSLHNYTWFDKDGIHPNNAGQEHIAQMLLSGLLTGSCDNVYNLAPISVTPNTDVCKACNITGYAKLINNQVTLYFDFDKTIVFDKATNMNANLLLGTFNCDIIKAVDNAGFVSIPITGYASYTDSSGTKYFNPVAALWISGKSLYLNMLNISDDGAGFKNVGTLNTMTVRLSATAINTGFC